jgi:hypothetical protein
VLFDNVEPALQPDKVLPRLRFFSSQAHQRFGPLARAEHQFLPIGRRVADAALNLDPNDIELGTRPEECAKFPNRFLHRGQFWPAGTADGNLYFRHANTSS